MESVSHATIVEYSCTVSVFLCTLSDLRALLSRPLLLCAALLMEQTIDSLIFLQHRIAKFAFQIAGYRLLLRWVGADEEGDERFDFWVNIGSRILHSVG
ncbi:hypothetical protein Y032_0036g3196 [Ancylostoma ceylanicum]|nr:hypothetical protein Y032_0036g3196 [Ancylostoma ceylanicum]